MAATAGGVAVGSAVGSVAGQALTGIFGGGSSTANSTTTTPTTAAPAPATSSTPTTTTEITGPCAAEIKDFIRCAQNQSGKTISFSKILF